MSPEQKRTFNTVTGSIFFLAAFSFIGLAIYFAITPNPPAPAPVSNASVIDPNSCVSAMQSLGFSATHNGTKQEITATETMAEDPDEKYAKWMIDRASMAASMCKYPLKEFCMGPGCSPAGVYLVLDTSTK